MKRKGLTKVRRTGSVSRKTSETAITAKICLDGEGKTDIRTGMPFMDHMFSVMGRHGFFDFWLRAQGDLEVDYHHTLEDLGIVVGELIHKALDQKVGIRRFGHAAVPMDETLAVVTLDLSGRPHLVYHVDLPKSRKIRNFDPTLVEHFFEALVNHGRLTLHINVSYGKNPHHILEAVFKAFGRALDQASRLDLRVDGVLSTKGTL